jgi:3-deoxy-D-manno-octulosonic-acid transferase
MAKEHADVGEWVAMAGYSLLLMAALLVGAPWWLARLATTGRYREGFWGRLGRVPAELRAAVLAASGARRVVWVHAVSVGEVLAATRLVAELGAALGSEWVIVVSTTTATGQALARERFGASRMFYYPLDFAWAVRAYLRVLKPELVVLMESEIWPRMVIECGRRGIPVAVVNARVSDRSYARGIKVRAVWGRVLRRVDLFLAQSEEDAKRLVGMGARQSSMRAIGNLKYDVRVLNDRPILNALRPLLERRRLVVAGSLLDPEEELLLSRWWEIRAKVPDVLLIVAPRHPDRFSVVVKLAERPGISVYRASELYAQSIRKQPLERLKPLGVVVLDTIGDLAAVYGVADVAFVGGSLVKRGGHNPLEPAQFGVPVVMGPSYENFRDVVGKMIEADGIRIVQDGGGLEAALVELLTDRDAAKAMGERGRAVFEAQSGATGRAVEALVGLVKK